MILESFIGSVVLVEMQIQMKQEEAWKFSQGNAQTAGLSFRMKQSRCSTPNSPGETLKASLFLISSPNPGAG